MKMIKPNRFPFTTGAKVKQAQISLKRKDAVIKNIEIIVACIVAFVAGSGIYEILK